MHERPFIPRCCRRKLLVALVFVLLGSCPRAGLARMIDEERALKIKAGMVLNFVRFTEWPADAFADSDSPIVITLLGEDELAPHVERVADGQRSQGRAVRVQLRQWPDVAETEDAITDLWGDLRASHAVVVFRSEQGRLDRVLAELKDEAVLTVSDIDGFAERGGMLGLSIRKDKVAVDANQSRIRDSGVKVSSQLLRLARIVETRGA